jgi:hypothetical protein
MLSSLAWVVGPHGYLACLDSLSLSGPLIERFRLERDLKLLRELTFRMRFDHFTGKTLKVLFH